MLDDATVRQMIGSTLAGLAKSEKYVSPRSIVRFDKGSIEVAPSYESAEEEMTIAIPHKTKGFLLHRFLLGVEGWTVIPEKTLRFATLVDAGVPEETAATYALRDELRNSLATHIREWRMGYAKYNAMIREARRLFGPRSVATDEERVLWRPVLPFD